MQTPSSRLPGLATCCCLSLALFCVANLKQVAADESDNAAARAYNGAAALQNAGLHDRAAQKWTEFLAAHPQDERIDRANFYLGTCQLRGEKFSEAAQTFAKVLATWPDFAQADLAQYNLALAKYEQAMRGSNKDLFRQAAVDFSTVATKFPASDYADDSLYFQGDCLFNLSDIAAALPVYQKLINQYPNSGQLSRGYYDLGIGQQELGKIEEAAKTFQAFLAKPEFASDELASEIRLRLAICLHELKQYDQAASEFETVAKTPDSPLAPLAAFRLGLTRIDQGKLPEAAQLLSDFANKFPASEYKSEALKSSGRCFYLIDKFQEAEKVLHSVAAGNDAAAAEAAYWLGKSQTQQKQADKALQTLEQAAGRFPDSAFLPHLKLARIDTLYELPQRRGETLPLYEEFLQQFPQHELTPQARYMAALSALEQSQYAKARQHAQPLLNESVSSQELVPGAMYIVAESLLLEDPQNAEGRDKALQLYRDLVAKYPSHTRAARSHLRIGWCLQSNEKFDEAIAHLTASLKQFDPQQQLPEAQLLIGQCHASLARHRESIAAFDAALAANGQWPRSDEVLIAASRSYQALGEIDPASARLRKLVETLPESQLRPQALYRLGEIAQQSEKPDEAIQWFQQLVDKHQDSPLQGPALYALTTVRFSQQNYPQTLAWADRLIQGNADPSLKKRGLFIRGLTHHRMKTFPKAIEDLAAYVNEPVEEGEAITGGHILALCHVAQKQYPQARAALSKVLEVNPKFADADKVSYELAHSLLSETGKEAEAAAEFQLLAEKYPDSELAAESWFRVAQYQEAAAKTLSEQAAVQQAWSAAESALKNGLAKAKEKDLQEKLQYKLGDVQFQEGRFDAAAKTLMQQLAEFPTGSYVAPAQFMAAESHYRQGQIDQALPLYVKMIDTPAAQDDQQQVVRYRAESLYRAGDCAAQLKRWADSEKHFRRLIDEFDQFPQRADAAYGLGYALQQQNKTDQAIATYEQLTQQSETESAAKARFMIGEIAFGQKRYEDAIENFLLVTVGYPYESWQALARFETARCFSELSDTQRAIETLTKMIEKHPQHARTADARKMLSELSK